MTQINSVACQPEQVTIVQKKDLTKLGNRICLLLILVSVFANIIQYFMIVPMSVQATLQHKAFDLAQNPLLQQLVMYIPTLISLLIILVISRKMLHQKISENYHKPKTTISFMLMGCLVAVGASMTGVLFSGAITSLLSHFDIQSGMANLSTPDNLSAKIVNIAYLCVIAPFLEETLFRGVILKSLRSYGNVFAIIASSVLFGIFHFNLIQLVPATLMGLVFAFLAVKSESIIPSILAHAFNNTVTVILALVMKDTPQMKIVYGSIVLLMIAITIIILILNRKEFHSLNEGRSITEMTGKQKTVKLFFRSAWFYVLIALFIINCVILSLSTSGLITKAQ